MTYPYENNPLNDYLKELRVLRCKEEEFMIKLSDDSTSFEMRHILLSKQSKIFKDIEILKEEFSVQPRETHVFKNEAQLAIIQFEIENPEPYAFGDCKHTEQIPCIQTFVNNTTHIVLQCTNCGLKTKSKKKSDYTDYKKLPEFDKSIGKIERENLREWKKKKNEIYLENITDGDDIPDIDFDEFCKEYEKNNPEPFSSSKCNHSNKVVTLRVYSENNQQTVIQCTDCGKHIENVKKNTIKDMSILPLFNTELATNQQQNYQSWIKERTEEYKRLHDNHISKIQQDIYEGKIKYIRKDTFSTYYDSPEWGHVRQEILDRDKTTCQSCDGLAECVHHITYERLGQEAHIDLISLCNECHNLVHQIQDKYSYSFRLTPDEIYRLKYKI